MSPDDDDTQTFESRTDPGMFSGQMQPVAPVQYGDETVEMALAGAGGGQDDAKSDPKGEPKGDPADDRFQDLYNKINQAHDREADLLKSGRERTDKEIGIYDEAAKKIAGRPLPEFDKSPKPVSPQELGKGAMEFMQVAAVMGAIAGNIRGSSVTALNAFSGMTEGFAKGNLQQYKAKQEEFNEATTEMKNNNQAKLDKYNLIWNNDKLTMDMKLGAIKAEAAQQKDEMTYNAAVTGDYVTLAGLLQKQEQWTADFAQKKATFELHQKYVNAQIERYQDPLFGMRSPSAMSLAQKKQEWKQSHNGQPMPADEISKFLAKQGSQVAATKYWEGGGKGATQLQATDTALAHLGTIEELGRAVASGDYPMANQIYQQLATATGKPAPTNFKAAMLLVGPEIVNAITAGGGGQAEREEATKIISSVSSPAQIAGAVATLKKMMAGRLGTAKRRFLADTGQSEADFNDRLSPEATGLLQGGGQPPAAAAPGAGAQPGLGSVGKGGAGGGGWTITRDPG
jgi:hypothetical protein